MDGDDRLNLAVSNTYHPGNDRGVGLADRRIAISIGTDVGFDVRREFWPEIVRKLRLPFREPGKKERSRGLKALNKDRQTSACASSIWPSSSHSFIARSRSDFERSSNSV